MRPSAALQAELEERRAALIRLRRIKVPYDDPRILNLGYGSPSSARKDFYRAVKERKDATQAEVDAYREEQNEVIEALLETFLPLAVNERDLKAADVVLKALDQQAGLNGWKAAVKAELSGPGGTPMQLQHTTLAKMYDLIRTAGDADDEDDDLDDETDGAYDEDSDDDSDPAQP
ncbi:hypothetical protein [Streptomyces sp. NPDC046862]|uniref:hypothetical protein n=1 Tax=Streptomyces sp. NPDC046862 TaxID=3154603 RepID=UPI0034514FB4